MSRYFCLVLSLGCLSNDIVSMSTRSQNSIFTSFKLSTMASTHFLTFFYLLVLVLCCAFSSHFRTSSSSRPKYMCWTGAPDPDMLTEHASDYTSSSNEACPAAVQVLSFWAFTSIGFCRLSFAHRQALLFLVIRTPFQSRSGIAAFFGSHIWPALSSGTALLLVENAHLG